MDPTTMLILAIAVILAMNVVASAPPDERPLPQLNTPLHNCIAGPPTRGKTGVGGLAFWRFWTRPRLGRECEAARRTARESDRTQPRR